MVGAVARSTGLLTGARERRIGEKLLAELRHRRERRDRGALQHDRMRIRAGQVLDDLAHGVGHVGRKGHGIGAKAECANHEHGGGAQDEARGARARARLGRGRCRRSGELGHDAI
jgi:hypothetical protein